MLTIFMFFIFQADFSRRKQSRILLVYFMQSYLCYIAYLWTVIGGAYIGYLQCIRLQRMTVHTRRIAAELTTYDYVISEISAINVLIC